MTDEIVEINIENLAKRFLSRVILVAGIALLGAMIGLAATHVLRPQYTARAIVTSKAESRTSSISLSLNSENSEPREFKTFREIVQDRVIVSAIQKRADFYEELYPNQWDVATKTWHEPPATFFSTSISTIKRIFGMPQWSPPDELQTSQIIRERLNLGSDEVRGFYTVSFIASTPERAKTLLIALLTTADDYIVERERSSIQDRIAHVQEALAKATVDDLRRGLITLFLDEERKLLVIDKGFVVDIVSPPYASSTPSSPKPSVFIVVGFATGGFLGVLILLLRRSGPIWSRFRSF